MRPNLPSDREMRLRRRLRRVGFTSVGFLSFVLILMVLAKLFQPDEIAIMMADAERFEATHPQAFHAVEGVHAARVGPQNASATFFLIHGSPGDWRAFSHYLMDPELTTNHQLVVPDRPGYGLTDRGKTMRSLADQARALVPWAEAVEGKRIWVGHSFGVPIIAKLAVLRPDLVDGMVWVAGAMSAEYERKRWFHRAGDTWVARWLLPSDWDVANQEAIAFEGELERRDPEWARIQSPTTIIHATDDSLADYRHVDFTLERMTQVPPKLVKLDSGDHFILWNRYEVIKREMLALGRP